MRFPTARDGAIDLISTGLQDHAQCCRLAWLDGLSLPFLAGTLDFECVILGAAILDLERYTACRRGLG